MHDRQKIILIAAADRDNGIAKNGTIPWNYPEDRAFFKAKTMNCPTIVGRKTFETLGNKPLPGRPAAVWTRNPERIAQSESCFASSQLDKLIQWCTRFEREIYVIGGADLYRAMLLMAERIHLSRIPESWNCDLFFPDLTDFVCSEKIQHSTFTEEIWRPKDSF